MLIGQKHFNTYEEIMIESVSIDIRDYRLNPLIYGSRIYILIILLCKIENGWNIWNTIYRKTEYKKL